MEINKQSNGYGITIQENQGSARERNLNVLSGNYKTVLRIKPPSGSASYLGVSKNKIHITNEEYWFKDSYTTGVFYIRCECT